MAEFSPKIVLIGSVQSPLVDLARRLQNAGFSSVTQKGLSKIDFEEKSAPDIAIFLPKIPSEPRNKAAKDLRKLNPLSKIVMLYDATISGTEIADAVINANCELDDLLRTIAYLTGKTDRERDSSH